MNQGRLNRREFLGALAVSGVALSTRESLFAVPARPKLKPANVSLFGDEAARLTGACMSHFWDEDSKMFRAPVMSAETVASDATHDRGYTLWASLLGLHALVEAEKEFPGHCTEQIARVYDGLAQYYSADLHAYTAWVQFPGNIDAYYDDNSWVVTILTEASLACQKTDPLRVGEYLARARTVMADFVVKGWDATGKPGGMRWGCDPAKPDTSDRGTSSTAGSALAALMLARAGVNTPFYTAWGHELLSWLTGKLMDKDGLIMDALVEPGWKPRPVKWTYNTGVPMRAYVEHYRLTKDSKSLVMASKLAKAALNRGGALFDRNVKDPAKRYYGDGTYFVHYLLDGLLSVGMVSKDPVLKGQIYAEINRSAQYAYDFLRDRGDGFYWRNWRLYVIGDAQRGVWERWTGQQIEAQYDASERSQEAKYAALPVQDRPRVKTLLANGGAARMFWLAARVNSISPRPS